MTGMRRLILAGLLVGWLGLFPSSVDAATLANLWVSTTGGTCSRSGTLGAFNAATACASMNAAYQAANAGDFILIKGGTYGDQTIADRTNLAVGSATVTMQVAAGETVDIVNGSISIFTHDFTLHGGDTLGVNETDRIIIHEDTSVAHSGELNIQIAGGQSGNRNVVVEDVHAGSVFITASGATLRFSEIGPHIPCGADQGTANEDMIQIWAMDFSGTTGAKNVTLEYNNIHQSDQRTCLNLAAHNDATQALGNNDGLIIRGNHYSWCGTQCIWIDSASGGSNNVLIENNMIEETPANLCSRCGPPGEISINVGTTNVTIRYNTIAGNINIVNGMATPMWKGNIFLDPMLSCNSSTMNGTFTYNVFNASAGVTCGTNAKRGTPLLATGVLYVPLVSTTVQADWHLSVLDTVAKGAGDPGSFPPMDIDGRVRVSPPYAGAAQVVGGGSPPAPPTGLGVIGQ